MNSIVRTFKFNSACIAILALTGNHLHAKEFMTENGWKGSWNSTLSLASGWRMEDQNKLLIGANDAAIVKGYAATAGSNAAGTTAARAAGYLGAANSDVGNLNYDKGDRYSTLARISSDLTLSKGNTGFKISGTAWYDLAMSQNDVPFGNQASGFNGATSTLQAGASNNLANLTSLGATRPLSDANFLSLNKFSGVALRELYAFDRVDLGGQAIDVRAGSQILRWGNTLFIQGLSQVSPVDVTALRKPGSEPVEALLPVWALSGKMALKNGVTLDGFYQFKHRASNVESCGTYWGAADFGYASNGEFCGVAQVGNGTTGGWAGGLTDARPDLLLTAGQKPKNGDIGFAVGLPVENVGRFGFHFMNISSRTPYLSGQVKAGTGVAPNNGPTAGNRMMAQWDYVNDIKNYGLTFNSVVSDWRLGAELSYSPNQPVQINSNSSVQSGLTYASVGPIAGAAALAPLGPVGQRYASLPVSADWQYVPGYDRFSKTQLVLNVNKALKKEFAENFGAKSGRVVAELGYQHSSVPAANVSATGALNSMLYGRGFIFGLPVSDANCNASGTTGTNSQPQGCKADGFFTPNAYGYRLRASLDYINVLGTEWSATPGIYFAHDVKGYSVDGQFNQGRKTVALSLAMNYKKAHEVGIAYTTYSNSAAYDVLKDRDNLVAVYRYKF